MLGFGFMVAASVGAQTVAVTNGDFESPTVSPGSFTLAAPPGWTLVTGGATDLGVFHPTVASWNDKVRVYVPEPASTARLVGLAGFARRRRARREGGLR